MTTNTLREPRVTDVSPTCLGDINRRVPCCSCVGGKGCPSWGNDGSGGIISNARGGKHGNFRTSFQFDTALDPDDVRDDDLANDDGDGPGGDALS